MLGGSHLPVVLLQCNLASLALPPHLTPTMRVPSMKNSKNKYWEGSCSELQLCSQDSPDLSHAMACVMLMLSLTQWFSTHRLRPLWVKGHFHRGHLRPSKNTDIHIAVVCYSYEVAMKIILWLGSPQHEELH